MTPRDRPEVSAASTTDRPRLMAVDLGLRTGLALFGGDGRLIWYRSRHFANRSALRRGVRGLLSSNPEVGRLVVEGGGPIAVLWRREADRLAIEVRSIAAETWRSSLGLGPDARGPKGPADAIARRVIDWSKAPRPTSLRHDAAEAILIGLWGLIDAGRLDGVPAEVR